MKRIFGFFLACAMVLCAGCAGKKEVKSIQLDPEANKVLVDTNTDIAIVTDPENVQLAESDFTVSKGGNIEVGKNSAEFSASQPGKYSITVKKDGITSNTIIITVVQEQSELAKSDILDTKSETDMNTIQSKPAAATFLRIQRHHKPKAVRPPRRHQIPIRRQKTQTGTRQKTMIRITASRTFRQKRMKMPSALLI